MAADKNESVISLLKKSFEHPYEGANCDKIKMGLSLISRPTAAQRQTLLSLLEKARSECEEDDPRRKRYNYMIDCFIEQWWPEERE